MVVTTVGGDPIDEYDLHVGAEIRVAGRKALTLATLSWIDQQARAMLVAKFRLEQEINKFRAVVPVPGQYQDSQRVERFDLSTHQHLPAGGRLNLRAMYFFVMGLVDELRQCRAELPRLPDAVTDRLVGGSGRLAPPPDWCPDRREAERREAEARAREALLAAQQHVDDTWRNDLLNWLNNIPLASSCCSSYATSAAAAEAAEAKGLISAGIGGGGGLRGGSGRAGGRSGSGGPSLAFNVGEGSRSGGAGLRGSGSVLSRSTTIAQGPASPLAMSSAGRQYGGPTSPRVLPLASPGTRPGSRQRAGS
ncbi:hypothetical protein GPECTOR_2g1575 [Gonium pectorale]|uniref:Uncharacterized protein n=1 Tax=Gonium pectorale TaxID=33097 RepID=A0A150H1Y3_GONPE|nr:hypothetical protein GPECTOR_2g1575 [Gonium pectorale]|eukprot:KXZ56023.1 hypothetical protein GPECTOR_2g1575 [Gonium pectorale]